MSELLAAFSPPYESMTRYCALRRHKMANLRNYDTYTLWGLFVFTRLLLHLVHYYVTFYLNKKVLKTTQTVQLCRLFRLKYLTLSTSLYLLAAACLPEM